MREQIYNLFANQSDMTWEQVLMNLCAAAFLGFLIFISYAISHRGTIYSKKFNASLVALTVLTGTVMTVIGNNIALSLGMVGALSIVRFRTAIKNPMDLGFLFWAISTGIICGAGFVMIAVIASIAITGVILLADAVPVAKAPLVLVVNSSDNRMEKKIMEVVNEYCSIAKVKSRNLSADRLDMVVEVRTKEEADLVSSLVEMDGILSASLIAHDGEVTF